MARQMFQERNKRNESYASIARTPSTSTTPASSTMTTTRVAAMIGTTPSVTVTPIAKATEGRARKILTGSKASKRRRYEDLPTIAESKRGRSERVEQECMSLSEGSDGEETVEKIGEEAKKICDLLSMEQREGDIPKEPVSDQQQQIVETPNVQQIQQ